MARIRTIKPEFWSDEKLSALEPVDRLVFLGLISLADDYGRVHDLEKVIDAFIFPNTSHSVRESLANLSRMVRIRRGKAPSGKPILEIVNWSRHQRVDKPQPKMALPQIDIATNENVDVALIRESVTNDSGMVRELIAPRPTTTDLRSTNNDRKSQSVSAESKKTKGKASTIPGFEEWYAEYPKKKARGDAEKAYPTAIEAIQATEQVTENQAVALLLAWTIERVPSLLEVEQKYRPHPATWLNSKGYRDEIVTNTNQTAIERDLARSSTVSDEPEPLAMPRFRKEAVS